MTRSRSGTARTKSSGGLPRSGIYGDNWGCSASSPKDGHSAVTNSHPHRDAIDEGPVFQPRPAIIDRRELEFSRVGVLRAISSSLRAASAFGLPPVPPTDVRLLPQEAKACFKYGSGQTAKSVYLMRNRWERSWCPSASGYASPCPKRLTRVCTSRKTLSSWAFALNVTIACQV
jgi:hypothetical protein